MTFNLTSNVEVTNFGVYEEDPREYGVSGDARVHGADTREEFKLLLRNAKVDGFNWMAIVYWVHARTETSARVKARAATRILTSFPTGRLYVRESQSIGDEGPKFSKSPYSVEVLTKI